MQHKPTEKSKGNAKKLKEHFDKLTHFPEEQKNNPLFAIKYKTDKFKYLNPNSPSDLEWWFEDEPEKMEIIEDHGFELLLMLEAENITLKEAADKLIEYYEGLNSNVTSIKPIRHTVISFDTSEEYEAFVKYATEPDNSEGMQRLREKLKNHKRANRRVKK